MTVAGAKHDGLLLRPTVGRQLAEQVPTHGAHAVRHEQPIIQVGSGVLLACLGGWDDLARHRIGHRAAREILT
jgi:hypothetical protein